MYRTVDASVMRQVNKQTVLSLIYQKSVTSRVAISEETGLNRATVSSLVDELIAEEFVEEIGLGSSTGGRKPILLRFNARAGYAVGVDVQITHVTSVLTNAARDVVHYQRLELEANQEHYTTDWLLAILRQEIQAVIAAMPASPHGVLGVGIALPGLINHTAGRVIYLPNLGLADWGIVEELSQWFPYPFVVDNDANCGAWSEYLTRRINNLVFVNAGVGIGSGIIFNGALYRGRDGIAGESGHTTIAANGLLCSCGNYGCWEEYASERGLARYLREFGVEADIGPHFVTDSVHLAQSGDPAFRHAFQKLGESLGIGLSNVLQVLNPEVAYLGGTVAEAQSLVLGEMHRVIRHRSMDANKGTRIVVAEPTAVALGAAGLAISQAVKMVPVPTA